MVGEVVDGELALREQEVLHGPAIFFGLGLGLREEVIVFANLGCELNVVGFDSGVVLLEL